MKRKLAASLLILIALSAFVVAQVKGQAGSFFIDGADAKTDLNLAPSGTLKTLVGNLLPRFIVDHANKLVTLKMAPMPAALTSLVGGLKPRFILQWANATNTLTVGYPVAMIKDTAKPVITALGGKGTYDWPYLTVDTDEYTTVKVVYGLQPGVYTKTAATVLFYTRHLVFLNPLAAGQKYYYRVTATDRSGNQTVSAEGQFMPRIKVFLPLLRH